MLDRNAQFVILTISRENIAQKINRVAERFEMDIRPLEPDDDRLTNAVCSALAISLPVDFGDPSAPFQEEQLCLQSMVSMGMLNEEDVELCMSLNPTSEEEL